MSPRARRPRGSRGRPRRTSSRRRRAGMTTFWSGSIERGHAAAPTSTTAPAETPAQMPSSRSSSARRPTSASAFETSSLPVELGEVEDLRACSRPRASAGPSRVALQRLGGDDLHVRVAPRAARGRCPSACRRCRGRRRTRRLGRRARRRISRPGRPVVRVGVGRVAVLERHVERRDRRRPARGPSRPRRSSRARPGDQTISAPYMRSESAALGRGRLRHHGPQPVAAHARRSSPARCPCCRWSARARSGPAAARPSRLGGLDQRARHAVLDRAGRVQLSSFAYSCAPPLGRSRGSSTSGVFPMRRTIERRRCGMPSAANGQPPGHRRQHDHGRVPSRHRGLAARRRAGRPRS